MPVIGTCKHPTNSVIVHTWVLHVLTEGGTVASAYPPQSTPGLLDAVLSSSRRQVTFRRATPPPHTALHGVHVGLSTTQRYGATQSPAPHGDVNGSAGTPAAMHASSSTGSSVALSTHTAVRVATPPPHVTLQVEAE